MLRVHKSHPDSGFTIIANGALQDARLSLLAHGLLSYLLSLPEGADCDTPALARKFPEGKRAIDLAKAELRALGYMITTRRQNDRGQVVTDVDVFDVPQTAESSHVKPMPDAPGIGQPVTSQPDSGSADSTPNGVKNSKKETTPTPAAPVIPLRRRAESPVEAPKAGRAGFSAEDPENLACVDLMARIGQAEPMLRIGVGEMPRVVPLIREWKVRGASDGEIRRVLVSGLPADGVRNAMGLIVHRLTTKMPPMPAPKVERVHREECGWCGRPVPVGAVCRHGEPAKAKTDADYDRADRGLAAARAELARRGLIPTGK
ncbi:hypothetical protein GCM10010466_29750 [Planomonospora alba]|uniref:Helix-turn-helix domain-containing protein n=1 Tax=Planomonospora alba TaxID=161354 RepID=A0ABP6N5B3_9ACTN